MNKKQTIPVLFPRIDNFTPPERTPWGGTEIVSRYKKPHGITTTNIVGESWEISGHPSFPNIINDTPITILEKQFSLIFMQHTQL